MADPNLSHLKLFYTGGGSNSNTTLSIGGAISSAAVGSQTLTATTTLISGVTLVNGQLNDPGNGTLTFSPTLKTLSWQPFNGSVGVPVDVSVDGQYFIQGASNGGGITVTVVAASLPTSVTTTTITVADVTQQLFLDQTKAESDAGVTKYHCFAIKNTHSTGDMVSVLAWIIANTPGADTITIALDSLAAGAGSTGPTAVADENTAPSGLTFVSPASSAAVDALAIGTLTAGQCRFIWLKQFTPSGISVKTPNNTFKLGWSMRA